MSGGPAKVLVSLALDVGEFVDQLGSDATRALLGAVLDAVPVHEVAEVLRASLDAAELRELAVYLDDARGGGEDEL